MDMSLTYAKPRRFTLSRLDRVIDGDTFAGVVDLGFDLSLVVKCRMARINAPELPTPEGLAAKAYLEHVVAQAGADAFDLEVRGRDKYGRWLAELVIRSNGTNVSDLMVKNGHAVPM